MSLSRDDSTPLLAFSFFALTPTMADIIQSFPPELLIEVLIHIPVPDVLGFKQVK